MPRRSFLDQRAYFQGLRDAVELWVDSEEVDRIQDLIDRAEEAERQRSERAETETSPLRLENGLFQADVRPKPQNRPSGTRRSRRS